MSWAKAPPTIVSPRSEPIASALGVAVGSWSTATGSRISPPASIEPVASTGPDTVWTRSCP